MRLHRFIGDFDLSKKEVEIQDPEIIKQIKGVLRLEVSDHLILGDGRGKAAEATILSMSPKSILAGIIKVEEPEENSVKVNLFLAILKKENFELAVQKAVESGVSTITPVITERTIKTGLNTERLEKIIREASEQSGRSLVPSLSPILEFEDALQAHSEAQEKIIFHLSSKTYSPNNHARSVNIFIGPEGGFTQGEVELSQKSGYTPASLGSLTLRGETAAIIATYRAVNRI